MSRRVKNLCNWQRIEDVVKRLCALLIWQLEATWVRHRFASMSGDVAWLSSPPPVAHSCGRGILLYIRRLL